MTHIENVGLIGGSGFVGSEIVKGLKKDGFALIAPGHTELDITDKNKVEGFIEKFDGKAVVLTAAYTNVDGAEIENLKANLINVEGTRNVAEACAKHGKYLIYLSTDFVFEGNQENPGPYKENSKTAFVHSTEIGEYAKTKIKAENLLNEMINDGAKIAIVRISYPFGINDSPRDFVNKIADIIMDGGSLYDDQQITPTFIPDLVEAIKSLLQSSESGIYHVATYPPTTPYEIGLYAASQQPANMIFDSGSLEKVLNEKKRAPRPLKGGLDCEETKFKLNLEFHRWHDAVDRALWEDLLSSK